MTRIVCIVGARPNFVKMAPVIHELRLRLPGARHVVVHTGQHYDPEMSEIFLAELGLSEPDHSLAIGSGAHGAQTARALERIEVVLEQERPDAVVVPGDVNSTLAGALAAVKLGIPVAHIEAGLRSYDRTMPEEINRVLVDQVSEWCFTHSPEAEPNLLREGVDRSRIHFVGNTMIDTLVRLRPRIERSTIRDKLRLEAGGYLLVTLHRPALVDGPLFEPTLEALVRVSRMIPVVFPLHPRTKARVPRGFEAPPTLTLAGPVGYVDFLALESRAAGVLTDSGGVQEETTFLRVPCFTFRATTERSVTISNGTNRLLGLEIGAIDRVPQLLSDAVVPLAPPAGWDGRAATRVADILAESLMGWQFTESVGSVSR